MLTSQVANCYPSLSPSTIFLLSRSLCFLCIFHFRYNDAKRRIRVQWLCVVRCESIIVINPLYWDAENRYEQFLLFFSASIFSFLVLIYKKLEDVFSLFSSLSVSLVLLCRSARMTITYSKLFNRKGDGRWTSKNRRGKRMRLKNN